MKTLNRIKGLVLACAMALAASTTQAEPLRLFAAASLQGPLDAVAEGWETPVIISYAGSGAIARQISQGAPADAVILANAAWADWLIDERIVQGPAVPLLSNSLVLIGPKGATPLTGVTAPTVMERLAGGRLAMGQHMSVPAGIYAQSWLEALGIWTDMRPHLAETENVRAALALVARREAPLGIVYASDARATNTVDVVWSVPSDLHPPIVYPGLALTEGGQAFLAHLGTRIDVFTAAGFRAP